MGAGRHVTDFDELNCAFETYHPREILKWAADTFASKIAVSSSFQTQGLPLLHMVSQIRPRLLVIFVDTGYHFPETLSFRDRLVQEWDLDLQVARSDLSPEELLHRYGANLYRKDPDLCCYIHKVMPMQKAISGLDAWVSGIRRDQSPARAKAHFLERTPKRVLRIHPMLTWTGRDIWRYINTHNLTPHPLFSQGYTSVGCAPCTRPVQDDEAERAGRWAGQTKTECGLHTSLRQKEPELVSEPKD